MIDGFMFFQGIVFVRSDNTNGIDGLMRMTCECEEWREISELYIPWNHSGPKLVVRRASTGQPSRARAKPYS